MAESISFEWNGSKYKLGFDRKSVMLAEKLYDLKPSMLEDLSLNAVLMLFRCAFIKHHPKMKEEVIYNLWEMLEHKTDLIDALAGMYADCFQSLLDEPKAEGKVIAWKKA